MTETFMNYVECDLADDEGLLEWKRARATAAAPRRRGLLAFMRRVSS